METRNEILEFIERRWAGSEELFLNGNCYWFAEILCDRFSELELMYLPVEGHFVAYDESDDTMYDVTGEVNYNGPRAKFTDILDMDYDWAVRLLKNCRD